MTSRATRRAVTRRLGLALLASLLLSGCGFDAERTAAEWARSLCESFGDCQPGCGDGRSGSSYCR